MSESHGHIVGTIANEPLRESQWETAMAAFEAKIEDFNIRGQREQVPHPGFAVICRYCPECGASLAHLGIRQPEWSDASAESPSADANTGQPTP